jgi:putative redox protein
MKHITTVSHKEDLSFEVELNGHSFTIDADDSVGGKDRGPRPKGLLLSGLAGCTGMDVASILKKMRVDFESFSVEVDAHQTEEHPKVYDKIHVRYIFTGDGIDREKVEKAVKLSEERYCGANAMLSKAADITNEVVINPGS